MTYLCPFSGKALVANGMTNQFTVRLKHLTMVAYLKMDQKRISGVYNASKTNLKGHYCHE